MSNTITRDLFRAFVRVHILHHAVEKPIDSHRTPCGSISYDFHLID